MEISEKISRDVHYVFASYFEGVEALAYAVSRALADGSICLDVNNYKLVMTVSPDALMENPFWMNTVSFDEQLKNKHWVTLQTNILKPFVLLNGKLYLHRYFTYETQIIQNISRLGNNMRIITGGPGTGKTFSVASEIVNELSEYPLLKIAMAAPTGKAAARMNESIRKFVSQNNKKIPDQIKDILLSIKAKTLHRLLGYVSNSVFFRYNHKNKLPYDIVIIDEASMIDGAMMAKLMNAIDEETIFMLIGDKDQLASVEAGSVFGDICLAKDAALLTGKLTIKDTNFRSTRNILEISKNVIDGNTGYFENWKDIPSQMDPVLKKKTDGVAIDHEFSETLFKEQALKYLAFIYETDTKEALKKLNDVRFLCATRSHDQSVAETNTRVEKFLSEAIKDADLFKPRTGFYHNQPIIITKNDYDLGLNNGDVGIVRRDGNGAMIAYFEGSDGDVVHKKASYLNHYETVFAMTIHKSQGSEFDNVVVLLPGEKGEKLLTRELLYTAVTRAKHNVLIHSSQNALLQCVGKSVSRASGLTERLKSA